MDQRKSTGFVLDAFSVSMEQVVPMEDQDDGDDGGSVLLTERPLNHPLILPGGKIRRDQAGGSSQRPIISYHFSNNAVGV